MIRALFFDNDGILVDTEKYYFQANRRIMLEHGLDLSLDEYFQFFLKDNCGMWHLLDPAGRENVTSLRSKRNDYYSDLLATEEIAIAGAGDVLKTLSKHFKIGVVTSSLRRHFSIIHGRTGFARYFDFVVAEGDYTHYKPDPEPYRVAVDRSGFALEECLAIEDSPRGLAAAKAAGLVCWAIPSELTRRGDFSTADKVLASISELPGLLEVR